MNFERASFETGLPLSNQGLLDNCKTPFRPLGEVFDEVKKCYIKDGEYIWIRNFLYHQKNLPLNPNSTYHRGIIKIINSHNSFGKRVLEEIELIIKERGLGDPLSNSIGNGNSKEKIKHKDFVLLTEVEHKKLIETFGEKGTEKRITKLNNYIGSKGGKYHSHYYTILNWEEKNETPGQPKQKTPEQIQATKDRRETELKADFTDWQKSAFWGEKIGSEDGRCALRKKISCRLLPLFEAYCKAHPIKSDTEQRPASAHDQSDVENLALSLPETGKDTTKHIIVQPAQSCAVLDESKIKEII